MKACIIANPHSTHQGTWGRAFGEGLKRHGFEVSVGQAMEPCALIVIWGTHNRRAIEWGRENATDVCILERGYVGDRFSFTSVSFGGELNNRARFSSHQIDSRRVAKHHAGVLKPWRPGEARNALIMGQVSGDAALRGIDPQRKYQFMLQGLRDVGMSVMFRPHPAGSSEFDQAPNLPGTLHDALEWADVTCSWNSNSGVDSVLAGVPHICFDGGSMAFEVSAQCFAVDRPDRKQWLNRLSYCQWTLDEMETGECWDHARYGSEGLGMSSGRFTRKIQLQRATKTRDARNAPVLTWSNLIQMWAERTDVSAGERSRAQEVGADVTTRFVIRHNATVDNLSATDRIVYDGKTYNITGVREVANRRDRLIEIDAVTANDTEVADA